MAAVSGEGQSTKYKVQSTHFAVGTTAAVKEILGGELVRGLETCAQQAIARGLETRAEHDSTKFAVRTTAAAKEILAADLVTRQEPGAQQGSSAQWETRTRERFVAGHAARAEHDPLIDLLAEAVARNRFPVEGRMARASGEARRGDLWGDGLEG